MKKEKKIKNFFVLFFRKKFDSIIQMQSIFTGVRFILTLNLFRLLDMHFNVLSIENYPVGSEENESLWRQYTPFLGGDKWSNGLRR